MADNHDENWEGFTFLARQVLYSFLYIQAVLEDLPVPVSVPDFNPTDSDTVRTVLESLDRARTLVPDEPIPEAAAKVLTAVILEWLTAYEITTLVATAGATPWRVDSATASLARLSTLLELYEELEPSPDSNDDPEDNRS